MKKIVLLFSLIIVIGYSCKTKNDVLPSNPIVFDIKLKFDTTVYSQGKPIIGKYSITNLSDIDFRKDVICKYMIIDSSKNIYYSELFNLVKNKPIEKFEEPYFFLPLEVKDSINSEYDFRNLKWNYWEAFYANIDSFPKGDYKIRMYLNVVNDIYEPYHVSNDVIIKIN